MKWLLITFLLTCAGFVSAQVNYHIDYLFSGRIENTHSQLNNEIGGGLSIKKVHFKLLGGVEKWYVKQASVSYYPSHDYYYSHSTLKTDLSMGYVTNISTTQLRVGIFYGWRFYFNNEVRDSVTLITSGSNRLFSKDYQLSTINRSTLAKINPYEQSTIINGIVYGALDEYAIVTRMPYAQFIRLNVGYTFKQFALDAYYMPYLIRFHYQNAANHNITGKNYLLFHDVGIGLSYTFSSKYKNQE